MANAVMTKIRRSLNYASATYRLQLGDPVSYKSLLCDYNEFVRAEQDPPRGGVIAEPDGGKRGEQGWPDHARRAGDRARTSLVTTYALMGVLLVGYLAFLLVRGPSGNSLLVSGWGAASFELAAGALCLARGVTRRPGRAVALTLGFAITSWALGDFALTAESLGGASPPIPSVADVFYLGFYPLAYVAVVLFIRGDTQRLTTPNWLDGAVASMGTAAVCAAFLFDRVLRLTGGDAAATATNLAYPIGDVLLLSLVMGGSTVLTGRRKAPWLLMATGLAINAVGDTANLFGTSFGASLVGFVFNGIAWPTSLLLLSISVWLPSQPDDLQADQKPTSFIIPGISAACALAVLFVGNLHETSRLALGLATTALLLVGIRLAVSVRGMRRSIGMSARREDGLRETLGHLADRYALLAPLRSAAAVLGDVGGELRAAATSAAVATSEQSAAVTQTSATIEQLAATAAAITDNVHAVAKAVERTGVHHARHAGAGRGHRVAGAVARRACAKHRRDTGADQRHLWADQPAGAERRHRGGAGGRGRPGLRRGRRRGAEARGALGSVDRVDQGDHLRRPGRDERHDPGDRAGHRASP